MEELYITNAFDELLAAGYTVKEIEELMEEIYNESK